MTSIHVAAIGSLLTACLGLAADVDPRTQHEVTALSQDGSHRLRLTAIEQTKSPWDENVCAASMSFRLEFAQDGPIAFLPQPPEDMYLDGTRLIEVLLVSGENVAVHKHSAWTDQTGPTVVIHTLELGNQQKEIQLLKLAVTLVKVTKWEHLVFEGIKETNNHLLHCGPFELACNGEGNAFSVGAGARTEFYKEHDAYRKQVPLNFLTHRYAVRHVDITDSRKRRLARSVTTLTGSSTSSRFSIQGISNFGIGAGTKTANPPVIEEPIAYPLTVKIKLPKRYETEQVNFELKNVILPALK